MRHPTLKKSRKITISLSTVSGPRLCTRLSAFAIQSINLQRVESSLVMISNVDPIPNEKFPSWPVLFCFRPYALPLSRLTPAVAARKSTKAVFTKPV